MRGISHRTKFWRWAGAVVPALAAAQPVYANGHGEHQDIVVTASRIPMNITSVGSAVSVITAQDLQAGQTAFVKDALQNLPGVSISSDRPGDFTSVSVRGSDNDQMMWLVDGIKLADPSATSTHFQPDHLMAGDIARIEVLRGNQSSLYGSDAIGGVVNIMTQRATAEGLQTRAEMETGAYGMVNAGASLLGRHGPVNFRISATGYAHDGPSLADPKTAPSPKMAVEPDAYRRWGLSGRLGVKAAENISVQMIGFWQDVFADTDDNFADTDGYLKKREYAAAFQANYESDDHRQKASFSLSRYGSARRLFGEYYAADGDLYRGVKDSATANFSHKEGIWGASFGGALEREATDQLTSYSDPFHKKLNNAALYAEISVEPIDQLFIAAAARFDHNSRFGNFATYRTTMAYRLQDVLGARHVKSRASFGTGSKAPGLYQLFDPLYGNEDLRVERSRGGDIGVDLDYGVARAEVSYFFTQSRNEILFDASLSTDGAYIQYGRTRNKGVEAAFTVKPSETLDLFWNITYLRSDKDMQGEGVFMDFGRPRWSSSGGITLRPHEKASITARARYRSENSASYGGVTPDFIVADLLGSVKVARQIELYGRVQNLFNADYQMTYGVQTLGRSAFIGLRIGH